MCADLLLHLTLRRKLNFDFFGRLVMLILLEGISGVDFSEGIGHSDLYTA